jgi:hypothetical protein
MPNTTLVNVNHGTCEKPSLYAILLEILSKFLIIYVSYALYFFSFSLKIASAYD